jgi:predicted nuclease of restriction endonuclease-like (RecB) superfamily
VRTLRQKIGGMLFQRTALSKNSQEITGLAKLDAGMAAGSCYDFNSCARRWNAG